MDIDTIYNEDCLTGMQRIPDGSVDCIICDLPYGTTQLSWDTTLPLDKLWQHWLRVAKENSAIILFGSQPFVTDLICSRRDLFKYEIIWDKKTKTNFYDAHRRPMKQHETLLVFYRKQPTYNPQKITVDKPQKNRVRKNSNFSAVCGPFVGRVSEEAAKNYRYVETNERFPGSIVQFSNWNGALFGNTEKAVKHPTQKPVDLLRWVIRSYSNEGDTILDSTIGPGTTAVAAIMERRHFIGFETNRDYYEIAIKRINDIQMQPTLFNV